jgi:hypothetical protein
MFFYDQLPTSNIFSDKNQLLVTTKSDQDPGSWPVLRIRIRTEIHAGPLH